MSGYHADNIPSLMGGFVLIRHTCLFGWDQGHGVGAADSTLRNGERACSSQLLSWTARMDDIGPACMLWGKALGF